MGKAVIHTFIARGPSGCVRECRHSCGVVLSIFPSLTGMCGSHIPAVTPVVCAVHPVGCPINIVLAAPGTLLQPRHNPLPLTNE